MTPATADRINTIHRIEATIKDLRDGAIGNSVTALERIAALVLEYQRRDWAREHGL